MAVFLTPKAVKQPGSLCKRSVSLLPRLRWDGENLLLAISGLFSSPWLLTISGSGLCSSSWLLTISGLCSPSWLLTISGLCSSPWLLTISGLCSPPCAEVLPDAPEEHVGLQQRQLQHGKLPGDAAEREFSTLSPPR